MCAPRCTRWRAVDALREKVNGRLWELDTGHDMMISDPGWMAEKLMALVP